jgi:hypothetical protein
MLLPHEQSIYKDLMIPTEEPILASDEHHSTSIGSLLLKAPKNFEPNHAVFARHHTTLPRCDCIGTLHGLYKGSLASYDPQGPDQLARYKRITHPTPC